MLKKLHKFGPKLKIHRFDQNLNQYFLLAFLEIKKSPLGVSERNTLLSR